MPKNPEKFEPGIGEEKLVEKLSFDPEKEITEDDWKNMRDILEKYREDEDWYQFSELAARMKILRPVEDLKLDEEVWKGMRNELEQWQKTEAWAGFFHVAHQMKILNPEEKIRVPEELWERGKKALGWYRKEMDWETFSLLAVEMKITNPEPLGFEEGDWVGMKFDLDGFRKGGHWLDFARLGARLTILVHSELVEPLDKEAWQGMRKQLEELREEGNWPTFAWHAAHMKILASPKVRIPREGGLKVKYKAFRK